MKLIRKRKEGENELIFVDKIKHIWQWYSSIYFHMANNDNIEIDVNSKLGEKFIDDIQNFLISDKVLFDINVWLKENPSEETTK